jgi:hypothetical protein
MGESLHLPANSYDPGASLLARPGTSRRSFRHQQVSHDLLDAN